MKTAHTPGPWTAETSWNDHARVCVTAKLGSFVSNNTRGLVCDTTHTPFLEQEKANAHLIAASPELFAAMHRLVSDHEQGLSFDIAWADAKAALAKATKGNP